MMIVDAMSMLSSAPMKELQKASSLREEQHTQKALPTPVNESTRAKRTRLSMNTSGD